LRHRDNLASDMTSRANAGIDEGGGATAADASSAASAARSVNRGFQNQFSVACMTTSVRVALYARVV
jgi:hypothetical protein